MQRSALYPRTTLPIVVRNSVSPSSRNYICAPKAAIIIMRLYFAIAKEWALRYTRQCYE